MADTPRGPRPTVTRRAAWTWVAGWTTVAALAIAAAVIPLVALEPGWTRERVELVSVPYGSCDAGRCRIRPIVQLPSGDERAVRLTIVDDAEMLPSNNFRAGGSILLWVHADHAPRSLRPMTDTGRLLALGTLFASIVLATVLLVRMRRLRRAHDPGHAGHVFDHVALRGLPIFVLVLALALSWWVLHRTVPRHDPLLPKQPTYDPGRS